MNLAGTPGHELSRRRFLRIAGVVAGGLLSPVPTATPAESPTRFVFQPEKDLIPAPSDPAMWPDFRRQLEDWRESRRQDLSYSDALYHRPEFAWTTTNFACCFLMMCDEIFYDWRAGRYTVKEFLDHGRNEFGGFDSVVLWHAYPRIGLDERNQFDFYRDMPGGLPGVRAVVHELQSAGVRAFINYNPWDTGTRREPEPDLDMLCEFVRALEVDGIFLDTMAQGAAEFRARLDAARPGVALESELALSVERVHDHHFSWAQGFADREVPGILRNKWFEPRHLQHQIKRWDLDHTGELHAAWMNGSGIMVWENVFGSWLGWNARDRSLLRSMLPIQRRFSRLWHDGHWTPLVPTLHPGVYANLWEMDELRLWSLINRLDQEIRGPLLALAPAANELWFDLAAGEQIKPGNPFIGHLPARGIGCLVAAPLDKLGDHFDSFVREQKAVAARFDADASFPTRTTKLRWVQKTASTNSTPADMATIPGATLELKPVMRVRECGFYESNPPDGHQLHNSYEIHHVTMPRHIELADFRIDLTPVTNAQFAQFLDSTGYHPRHPKNFLKHWIRPESSGLPLDRADHPVVYVDLDDARAYAQWRGKRLPTEEEWQYAAAGPEALRYPWGHAMLPNRCNAGQTTTSVRRFPEGRSPFGIYDLCGNVWEWTESERSDGRTRFCILKGGSYFAAKGSNWYLDGGPQPNNIATKCLLLWPGLDRCGTVGFRCAKD